MELRRQSLHRVSLSHVADGGVVSQAWYNRLRRSPGFETSYGGNPGLLECGEALKRPKPRSGWPAKVFLGIMGDIAASYVIISTHLVQATTHSTTHLQHL